MTMTTQDYRIQENHRQDDYGDDPRRGRYEDTRRYQSVRRDLQEDQAGYGRGRDFGSRDEYWRDADNIGRRGSEVYGRNRLEADYYGGENPPAQREYRDRGRDPRSQAYAEEGNRLRGFSAGEREYGSIRNQRLGFSGESDRDAYAQGFEDARQRFLSDRSDDWVRGEHRDERARYHGVGPKNYKRSDERIREDVSDLLTDDPYVNASEIEVNVHNGEVTLSGAVEDRSQRRRAEFAAEQVSGVVHIQNNLRAQSAAQKGRQPAGQVSGATDPAANAPRTAGLSR
jgi:osmotically-inducible protein OsmY